MANMIAAFFENTEEESLFDDLIFQGISTIKNRLAGMM